MRVTRVLIVLWISCGLPASAQQGRVVDSVHNLSVSGPGKVKSLTEDGIGCDVVLEAAGNNKSVNAAVDMLRRGGRLMEFSVFAEDVCLDWSIISDIKELEIIGGHLGFHTYPSAIDFLSKGLITSKGIVTEPYPLSDFKNAIDISKGAKDGAIKVLMNP